MESLNLSHAAARNTAVEQSENFRRESTISTETTSSYSTLRDHEPTWERLLKLEELTLPAFMVQHLKDYGTDATAFLNDRGDSIEHATGSHGIENFPRGFEQFSRPYRLAEALEERELRDNFRMCYAMLYHYDMMRASDAGRINLRKLFGP